MANLNFDYNQLAAVVSVALILMNYDDNIDDREVLSLKKSLQDQYNITEDQIKELVEYAQKMEVEDALQHIKGFDAAGKQFASNFFGNIILADGQLTQAEKDVYFQLLGNCDLPNFQEESLHQNLGGEQQEQQQQQAHSDESQPVSSAATMPIAPTFLSLRYVPMTNTYAQAIPTFPQFEERPITHFKEYYGAEEIYIAHNTDVLNVLSEKINIPGMKVGILYPKSGGLLNKAATSLAGFDIRGSAAFCLEDEEGYAHGFTTRGDLTYLVNALEYLLNNIAFSYGDGATPGREQKIVDDALEQINQLW